ncbi:MAG TPA: CvpA family protein [Candidatus Kapabacteria bacterium]
MVLDLILLVLLLLSAYSGWRSGAMAMVVSVVVLIAAVLLASAFGWKVGTLLHVGPNWLWPIIGFLLTFIVLLIGGSWVKRLIKPKTGLLRGLDGLVGAFLGLIRAMVILGMILALFQLVHLPPTNVIVRSMIYPVLIKCAAFLIGVLRPYLHTSTGTGDVEV